MDIPSFVSLDLLNKRVTIRCDLDVAVRDGVVPRSSRLDTAVNIIKKTLEKSPEKIFIIGHIGRPDGRQEELSTQKLLNYFTENLGEKIGFMEDFDSQVNEKIILFENLRFWKGEEENSAEFAGKLALLGDVYINEAFAASHREHASIALLPQKVKEKAAGERFLMETANLSKVTKDPARPMISILSGVKNDKISYIEPFKVFSDKVLVAGRLPEMIHDTSPLRADDKVLVANLNQDKEDITIHSIEAFEEQIEIAGTILLSGPIGKFEEEGHRMGTQRVFTKVANSDAFKVAGGGDTDAAIELLGLADKFDFISIGGGAMLEFLAQGTLPGIEALLN